MLSKLELDLVIFVSLSKRKSDAQESITRIVAGLSENERARRCVGQMLLFTPRHEEGDLISAKQNALPFEVRIAYSARLTD